MGTQGTVSEEQPVVDGSSSEAIRIENLRKTFANGEVVACEDINLTINSDEFVVLLGPSGCGKTTTLRCISGLESADSGEIIIDDENVTGKKPKDRDLAFVFQSIALFPHMSVRGNIQFGLDMKTDLSTEETRERVEEVVQVLGIEGMLDRKPAELSGGQQQRVSLGRAMVMEPKAFLLDEPFSALDANLRDKMRIEIKKLQRELERAMIFVTHDQEEAMTLGDTIVVMDDGHIQQIGSPHRIYNEPKNLFVANFIGSPSTNLVECTVRVEKETAQIKSDLFTFELSAEQKDQIEQFDSEPVTLGVRPEYLDVSDDNSLFDATISVVEPLGANDAVYLDADGHELTALVSQGTVANTDKRTSVSFERDAIWLFDRTGERIL